MDKQKKVTLIKNAIMVTPVVAGLLLTLTGGYKIVGAPRVDSVSTSLSKSGADMSSLRANVALRADELYAKLKNGEITISEFSSEYSMMTNDTAVEKWARESEDMQVQEIVAKYDEGVAQVDQAVAESMNYFCSGMGVLGVSAMASVGLENYLKKKYGLDNEADMDSMDKSEVSAMDIEA